MVRHLGRFHLYFWGSCICSMKSCVPSYQRHSAICRAFVESLSWIPNNMPVTEEYLVWIWAWIHKWRSRKADPQSDPNKTAAGRWYERRKLIQYSQVFCDLRQKNHLPAIVHLPIYNILLLIKQLSDKKTSGLTHTKRTCNLSFCPPQQYLCVEAIKSWLSCLSPVRLLHSYCGAKGGISIFISAFLRPRHVRCF